MKFRMMMILLLGSKNISSRKDKNKMEKYGNIVTVFF